MIIHRNLRLDCPRYCPSTARLLYENQGKGIRMLASSGGGLNAYVLRTPDGGPYDL
jgi:hypothetical protein